MDTFVQSEVEAVSKGRALILPKGRVQLFGDPEIEKNESKVKVGRSKRYTPEDYNVQETEENRAASQGAGPGLKKKTRKLDEIPHQADFTLKYSDPQVLRYSGNQVLRYSGTQVLRYSDNQVLKYSGTQVLRLPQATKRVLVDS